MCLKLYISTVSSYLLLFKRKVYLSPSQTCSPGMQLWASFLWQNGLWKRCRLALTTLYLLPQHLQKMKSPTVGFFSLTAGLQVLSSSQHLLLLLAGLRCRRWNWWGRLLMWPGTRWSSTSVTVVMRRIERGGSGMGFCLALSWSVPEPGIWGTSSLLQAKQASCGTQRLCRTPLWQHCLQLAAVFSTWDLPRTDWVVFHRNFQNYTSIGMIKAWFQRLSQRIFLPL